MSPGGRFCITRSEAELWLGSEEVQLPQTSGGLDAATCSHQAPASGLDAKPSSPWHSRLRTRLTNSVGKSNRSLAEARRKPSLSLRNPSPCGSPTVEPQDRAPPSVARVFCGLAEEKAITLLAEARRWSRKIGDSQVL